jgi:hypothetical protein
MYARWVTSSQLVRLILRLQEVGVFDFETLNEYNLVLHMNTLYDTLQCNGSYRDGSRTKNAESTEEIFTTFKVFEVLYLSE